MDADGLAAPPPTEAEMVGHEVLAPVPDDQSVMEQDGIPLQVPLAAPDEASGISHETALVAGEQESSEPLAAAALSESRKRKSAAPQEPDTEGTPSARRGRSSVGATDSPAADSSAKKSKSAAKAPQVRCSPVAFNTLLRQSLLTSELIPTSSLSQEESFSEYVPGEREQFGTFIIQARPPPPPLHARLGPHALLSPREQSAG